MDSWVEDLCLLFRVVLDIYRRLRAWLFFFLPHMEVFSVGQVDLSIDFRIPSEPTRMFRRGCKLYEDIVGVGNDLTEQEGSQILVNR